MSLIAADVAYVTLIFVGSGTFVFSLYSIIKEIKR